MSNNTTTTINNTNKNKNNHNPNQQNNNIKIIKNPVVAAQLPGVAPHPYSSTSASPDGKYAILAGKDTLRFVSIGSNGLEEVRTIRISQVRATLLARVQKEEKNDGRFSFVYYFSPLPNRSHPMFLSR